ncbi:MAG: ribonuclease Y [Cyanobacteria bacterium SIG30]|nr:ribonuclease Y [Cyanobacteria bacterium SIG30]
MRNDITVYLLYIVELFLAVLAIVFAVLFGRQKAKVETLRDSAKDYEKEFVKRTEIIRKEALITAKEQLHNERQSFENEVRSRREEISRVENKLAIREDQVEEKMQKVTDKQYELDKKYDELIDKEDYLAEIVDKQTQELERISQMSKDEAKNQLFTQLNNELAAERVQVIRESEIKIKEACDEKAREFLSQAMQKCAVEQVIENSVNVVSLPSDEMKGRIIGREGRNIRTLETITGVDLIIDDTPEAVVISCFDPVRRAIAKLTLETLIADGRIHPSRIEETYEKSKNDIENKTRQEGERAATDLGIMNLNRELTKTLGRLYYRTSYGQNVLKHSIEVAQLSGMLAAELGVDVYSARRAGLLHDIGKAVDQEQEGTHVQLGVELARKYGENEEIVHAIEAHHDDVAVNSMLAAIVKIADTLSAGRPGARRDTLDVYIKRLKKLEEIANSQEGIKQSFAVSAGREVRVIVQPNIFDDMAAEKLARDIVARIENEVEYPGQIRVTVVREVRVTEIAK